MDDNMNQTSPEEANESQQAAPAGLSQESKNMAMLCHLLAIFTGFLGPLILWLIKKDQDPYVDSQGKEALNFQITVTIALFAAGILSYICIGLILLPIIGICDLIFCIMACLAASKGENYRYPATLRLVK